MGRGPLNKRRIAALRLPTLKLWIGICVLLPLTGACSRAVVNLGVPSTAAITDEADAISGDAVSVWDGVFTRPQASRGEERFQQVCAACHRVNEFSGNLFRRSWNGSAVGDLFNLIYTTMPDGNPASLPLEAYAEIVAFILSSNDYPDGEEDLPTDLFELGNIRVVEAPE
jgi:hypothetical protein